MRAHQSLLMFSLSGIVLASSAWADDKPYASNKQWSLYTENSNGHFFDCNATRNDWDGSYKFSIYEGVDGYISMDVSGVKDLLDTSAATVAGSYQVDNGKPVAFEKGRVYDSTAKPGDKYVEIDVPYELRDQLGKAKTVVVTLPKGSTAKFPMAGGAEIFGKMTACIDEQLAIDLGPGTDNTPTFHAPAGWIQGMDGSSTPLMYFSAENPDGANKGAFGIVQMKDGTYSLRLRDNADGLKTAADGAKREAATIDLGAGSASFIIYRKDSAVDVTGLTADDLKKLPSSGTIKVTSLEAGANFSHDYPVGVDLGAAGKAMASPSSPNDPPSPESLAGKYYVRGLGNDGKYYYGDAIVSPDGDHLKLDYTWSGGKTLVSKASVFQQFLTAIGEGDTDPFTYNIGKDHIWRGALWRSGKAVEYLIPKANQ